MESQRCKLLFRRKLAHFYAFIYFVEKVCFAVTIGISCQKTDAACEKVWFFCKAKSKKMFFFMKMGRFRRFFVIFYIIK